MKQRIYLIVNLVVLAAVGPGLMAQSNEATAGIDWYKTQFGTGGLGNCGPAAAAMGVYWATLTDISVRQVRTEIGDTKYGRATSLAQQKTVLDNHAVANSYTELSSIQSLVDIIDRGNIAILWIHTGPLEKPSGDKTATRIGRYYEDEVGHYIVAKGYTASKMYFVCHDPIPGDWATNTTRYPDGSMLGNNRHYAGAELWASLMSKKVIEISRQPLP